MRKLDVLEAAVRNRDLDDPYRWVQEATVAHRRQHECWAYPFTDGTVLGAIGAAVAPRRVLELGTALGYTACWWGCVAEHVDTVEKDPEHVRLACEHLATAGLADRVTVHCGTFQDVLPQFTEPFDVTFFDGYAPNAQLLELVEPLIHPSGVLLTTNLSLDDGFQQMLATNPAWSTRLLSPDTAVSLRI
jgi:predicted O-methyltransferase YrrM